MKMAPSTTLPTRPMPPRSDDAADDAGGDRFERHGGADIGLAGFEPRRQQRPAIGGQRAAQHIGHEEVAAGCRCRKAATP